MYAHLIGTDFVDHGKCPENGSRTDDDGEEGTLRKTVKPCSGNFETELIVQGGGDVAHHAAGFGEERKQTALKDRAGLFHGARTVKFNNKVGDELSSQNGENPEEDFCNGSVN